MSRRILAQRLTKSPTTRIISGAFAQMAVPTIDDCKAVARLFGGKPLAAEGLK